jgi:hypothetical protein
MVIYYTALPFVRLENGGLAPGEAVECPHSSAVIRRADAMFRNEANAGAVALACIDSPDLGDFDFTGMWNHPAFPWFEPPASGAWIG